MKKVGSAGLLAAVAFVCTPVQAQVDPPTLHGTSVQQAPWLAGSVVATSTQAFDFTTTFVDYGGPGYTYPTRGSVTSSVVRAVDGTYDFYWRITNTTDGVSAFDVDLRSFAGLALTPGWRLDGPSGRAPQRAEVSGSHVTFGFTDRGDYGDVGGVVGRDAPPRTTSFFLDTNAHAFDRSGTFALSSSLSTQGGIGAISGGSPEFATFSPSNAAIAPVPEPGTWATMLLGIALLGLWFGKRRPTT